MSLRAPKQPARERRRNILKGARRVFAEASYRDADTAALAGAAGVKPAALYRYFPSKRDLYMAVLDDAAVRLRNIWKEALELDDEPIEAIRRIGLAYYDHREGRSDVMSLWFRALSEAADPQVRETLASSLLESTDLFTAYLEEAQRNGQVSQEVDARVAAWHFMAIGLLFDLLEYLGLGGELDREAVDQLGSLYIGSLVAGKGEK